MINVFCKYWLESVEFVKIQDYEYCSSRSINVCVEAREGDKLNYIIIIIEYSDSVFGNSAERACTTHICLSTRITTY